MKILPLLFSTAGLAFADTAPNVLFEDYTNTAVGMPIHGIIAVADLDGDGANELVVNAHNSANDSWSTQIWKKQSGMNYVNVTEGSGLNDLEAVTAGDFNCDGHVDFIHVNGARNETAIYRNDGSGRFTKVSIPAAESAHIFGFQDSIRAVDIDSDGDLDLVFGKAVGSGGAIVAVLNQSRNGGSTLQPFSGSTTLAVTSWIHNKAEVTDANGDGKPDLLSIRTAGDWPSGTHPDYPVTLFLNTGNSIGDYLNSDSAQGLAGFVRRDNCGIAAANVMSPLATWDVDNDGDLDLINGSSDWPWVSVPHIYINDGYGNYDQVNSPVYQSSNYYHHWVNLFDADFDGDVDAVWTGLHNFSNIYPRMWRNDGALAFSDVTATWGVTARIPGWGNLGMNGYHADLDGDGDFDFVVDMWGSGRVFSIYRNNAVQSGANWLGIKLIASSSAPNGLGARVEVISGGKKLTQYMADMNGGVRNFSDMRFGLGASASAESVKVYWPSGQISNMNDVAGNQIVSVTENDYTDKDSDGLTAYDELVVYGTNPIVADTDGDGLTDGLELGVGRFKVVSGSFTWQQARSDALSKSGDLASFPTEDRWNRALQNLGSNPFEEFIGLWIGASDAISDGSWTWVNGEAFSFGAWGNGRPSSTSDNSLDFAEVSGGRGTEIGKWYDCSPATSRDGYLLEIGYASNPLVADTDGDGLNDGEELTSGAPAAPTNLAPIVANGQVTLAFTAGVDGASPVANYQYSTDNGISWTSVTPAVTSSPVVITGLTNGTSYSIRLRAANAVGVGAASDAVTATPIPIVLRASAKVGVATSISVSKLATRASSVFGTAATVASVDASSEEGETVALAGSVIQYTPAVGFAGVDRFRVTFNSSGGELVGLVEMTTTGAGSEPSPPSSLGVNPGRLTPLSAGRIGIQFNGIPGVAYQLQRSTDLVSWTTVATITAGSRGEISYTDENPPSPNGFYRLSKP